MEILFWNKKEPRYNEAKKGGGNEKINIRCSYYSIT